MKVHTRTVGTRTQTDEVNNRCSFFGSPVVFKGHQHSIRAGEQDRWYAMLCRRDVTCLSSFLAENKRHTAYPRHHRGFEWWGVESKAT